ncbi:TraR/DksA family transcriptional regulator [Streptomyces sp. NPDC001812]|uniref:TraR/DksA family transcriptional regulator n=1 Tax=Streptomyces cathayae TaxID=3031124 RepID=A0ABY8K9G0_9ACTN|nr:TraR/DksA family transcriptional regulator [Streptomyces sp. HUAS 5]WGD43496.1 TraR/DksA family transcriptional regulator [Streptomyces sp. HUAS 5]
MVAKKTADEKSAPSRAAPVSGGGAEGEGGRRSAEEGGKAAAAKGAAARKAAAKTAAEKKTAGKAAKGTAAKKAAGKKAVSAAAADGSGGETAGAGAGVGRAGASRGVGERAGRGAAHEGTTRTSGGTQDMAGRGTATDAGAAEAATQTGATTVGAKKTPGTATTAKTAVPKARIAAVEPGDLAVRPGEDPWTLKEVEDARVELMTEVLRLREEISSSERSLAGLMRDSGDGAGDDQADTGTKNITREHELALAANAREMLTQYEHAMQRLDAGTYGLCENCGDPIGKARMQAFPRATLCVECKQKQERRY